MTTGKPISERQNDPDMLELLRAATTSYVRVQRLEAIRVIVSLTLAAAGLVAAFVDAAAPPIAIAGAAWAIAFATGIYPWAKGQAKRAATIQEMFDTELFDLPWNSTAAGLRLAPHELHQLARKLTPRQGRHERLRNWYIDTGGIPRPYDVFICQLQNLGWDARLRRRWANTLLLLIIGWLLLGIVIGYIAELTIAETLIRWYLPATGAVLLGIEGCRGQRDIAAERERVIHLVQAEIDQARKPPLSPAEYQRLTTLAREIQDAILATRKHVTRVPDWFYARFRDADEQDFQINANILRRKVTGPTSPLQ